MKALWANGYTLIEIMVALSIFALLAVITSGAMVHAFDTRDRTSAQADRLNALQLAIILLERDTEQAVDRAIHGNDMHVFPSLVGEAHYAEWTRAGIVNPNQVAQHSSLQRMGWLCRGKQLIRRRFSRVDTPDRRDYQDKVVLNNLDLCEMAYVTASHQVLAEWRSDAIQQNQTREPLPIALRVTLTLHDWGNMSLLFPLPGALYAA